MMECEENKMDLANAIKSPVDSVDIPSSLVEVTVNQPEEIDDDEICQALKEDEVPETLLKAVLWGFAEEQASLKSLRHKKQNEGKDTSYISLKRGTLLKYMSETLLQKQALSGSMTDIDIRGPKFREVFKMFLGVISDTFDEIHIPIEYKEMFFHALSKNIEGWEDRAQKLLKAMTVKVR